MKSFRTIDDIERDKEIEEREKFKRNMTQDLNYIFNDFFPKKEKKKKKFSFFKLFSIILLILVMITLILGCIWLIKFFLQGIF